MTKFLLSYHGGSMPQTPEDGARVMKAWTDWMTGLGKAIVEPGNPTGGTKTIAANGSISAGGGANAVTGYSVIEAGSLDAAIALAKSCPQLASGGSVEVGELIAM